MSVVDLVWRGRAYANFAIECDQSACLANDPSDYEKALYNYMQAIDLYGQAHNLERDPAQQERLKKKIAAYGDRCSVLKEWLSQYLDKAGPSDFSRRPSTLAEAQVGQQNASVVLPGVSVINESAPTTPAVAWPKTRAHPHMDDEMEAELEKELVESISLNDGKEETLVLPDKEPNGLPEESGGATDKAIHAEQNPKSALGLLRALQKGKRSRGEDRRVEWSDIAGLERAKEVMKEATVIPEEFADLYGSERQRWKTILLYGTTGNGKNLLVNAAADEGGYELIPLRISDVISRNAQESEEMVLELFALARTTGKVLLHMTDVELLFGTGHVTDGEGMLMRRVRAQLLEELGRTWRGGGEDGMVFVGSSRAPWLLDEAFIGRMQKRIYVELPNARARAQIVVTGLREVSHNVTVREAEDIAAECEGFSGADVIGFVREAVMEPIRVVRDARYFKRVKGGKYLPCGMESNGAKAMTVNSVPGAIVAPKVSCLDFEMALLDAKPSVCRETVQRCIEFTNHFGQSGA